jgi:hypothetical protein
MKLHKQLAEYLAGVEAVLDAMQGLCIDRYVEELLTPQRANIRLCVRFANGCRLDINEAVLVEHGALQHQDYRYHCQDADGTLIFRYDSTPHFPELPTFPHHKHCRDRVVSAQRPSIAQVFFEASSI